jgi:hypothetical protein
MSWEKEMDDLADNQSALLAVEAKRKLVYGSFMLYGMETVPLRERAMDQAVLGALVGSSKEKPFKNGEIQSHLRVGTGNVSFRPEIINETLRRLHQRGQVDCLEERRKNVYFLTTEGERVTSEGVGKTNDLFAPVLDELLQNSEHFILRSQAIEVCKDFICTAFVRFGSTVAAYVGGHQSQIGNPHQLAVTFDDVAKTYNLSEEATTSLRTRCLNFFRSDTIAATRLIFHLTQGYCFARLLGIDRNGFNPIAEQAFKDSVIYCDTNVLFAGLLPGDKGASFTEILHIAKRSGIDLRVTRATVNETRFAAADRLPTLQKIAENVPEEIAKLSPDEFVTHYFEARKLNPELTPEEFLSDFDSIAQVVRERWGLTLEELTEDEILEGTDIHRIEEMIQQVCVDTRGYKKNEHVLKHDAAHYVLIKKVRTEHPKAWFLTRDQTLINASITLAKVEGAESKGFCFSMLGFLQSISPFVSTTAEGDTIAEFFSSLLKEQVFISEKLFDGKELALMAEMHADVMSTPVDQLIPAVDYIKNHILKGQPYRTDQVPIVALELRKFLASSTSEKQKALEARADQLAVEHEAAARIIREEREQLRLSEIRWKNAEDNLAEQQSSNLAKQAQIDLMKEEELNRRRRNSLVARVIVAFFLVGVALTLGHYSDFLGTFAAKLFGNRSDLVPYFAWCIKLIKFALLLFPVVSLIRHLNLSQNKRNLAFSCLFIGWVFVAGIQATPIMGTCSNVITVACFLVLFFSRPDK